MLLVDFVHLVDAFSLRYYLIYIDHVKRLEMIGLFFHELRSPQLHANSPFRLASQNLHQDFAAVPHQQLLTTHRFSRVLTWQLNIPLDKLAHAAETFHCLHDCSTSSPFHILHRRDQAQNWQVKASCCLH